MYSKLVKHNNTSHLLLQALAFKVHKHVFSKQLHNSINDKSMKEIISHNIRTYGVYCAENVPAGEEQMGQ